MSKGYVYVLSNPSMPGIVKIGYSKHGGQSRADALFSGNTAVAMPFKLEFEILVEDYAALEAKVHSCYKSIRVNKSREFFWRTPEQATMTIISLALEGSGAEVIRSPFNEEERALFNFTDTFGIDILAFHIARHLQKNIDGLPISEGSLERIIRRVIGNPCAVSSSFSEMASKDVHH